MAEPRDAGAAAINPLSPYQVNIKYGGGGTPYSVGINAPGSGAGWFGALTPMTPVAPPEVAGRSWDFAPGYNLAVQPRSYEPVGFSTLRMLGRSYDLMRTVIETRKDQMSRMPWDIRVREVEAKKRAKVGPGDQLRINLAKKFFGKPDGVNRFRGWFRGLLEDVFVIDAPTLYCRRTRGGKLYSLNQIDGSIIKPVIDDWGNIPQPFAWNGVTPFVWNSRQIDPTNYRAQGFQWFGGKMYPPAFQSILKGMPATDYTTRDLIYKPYNPQPGSPYGFSPVEQIIITVNIALRRQLFTLSYFTEGNIPDALISAPESWTPQQIGEFQNYFDAMLSGNLAQRRKAKFVPGGVGKQSVHIKDPELTGKTDEWLARIVCFAFSVSPQPFMAMINRATANTAKETAEEEGLEPVKAWSKELFDDILEMEFNSPDLEFVWVEETEIDQVKQATILTDYTKFALLAINEARDRLGEEPFDDPACDQPMVWTASGYVPVNALTIEGKQANMDAFGTPDGSPIPAPPVIGGKDSGSEPGKGGANGKTKPLAGAKVAAKPKAAAGGDAKAKGVGKLADAPFVKRRKRLAPISTDRPLAVRSFHKMKAAVADGLHKLGKHVTAQVRRELAKVEKDKESDDKAKQIAEELDLKGLEALIDPLIEESEAVASDAAQKIIAQLGVEDRSDLVDQVNEAAALWARGNVGELINLKEEGLLADATRDMIRNQIADGLEANIGMDAIADQIMESTAFSADRAELIARTEIRRANSQGSLLGAKEARDTLGLVMKKLWLTAGDDLVDEDVCQPNEDQGAIGLDEDFESGDDAPPGHPRCRCAISYEFDSDDMDEAQDDLAAADEEAAAADEGDDTEKLLRSIDGLLKSVRDNARALAKFDEGAIVRDDKGKFSGGSGGFKEASAKEFIAARDKSERAQFLSAHTEEELAAHTLLMNADHTVGIAVDKSMC